MQLRRKRTIGASLAAATTGLLGGLHATNVVADEVPDWGFDTVVSYWGESDGRVQDVSLTAAIRRIFDEGRVANLTLTVDSLTGASPSGAVPSDTVQTFTRPSGNGSYEVGAGEAPLDSSFLDTRLAMSLGWKQSFGASMRFQLGASGSTEYDYDHLGINGRFERDFNLRNTTVFLGAAYGSEEMDPVGGTPIAFAPMRGVDDQASKLGTESKDVIDALLGITQVIDRRTLVEVAYSFSQQDGYLNDPYKVLTVVDPVAGRPVAGPIGSDLNLYLFESRPDSRTKHSLFTEVRYAFDRDSIAVNYRIMDDDWGVLSHTLEARYRWNFSERQYVEPHLRYYMQSQAAFYRTVLVDGEALPQFASADYRLADLDAFTVGFKYGYRTTKGEFSLRLEYYRQTASESSGSSIGVLSNYDLVPPLDAVIAQVGYKFEL